MNKYLFFWISIIVLTFAIDQMIKIAFVSGLEWRSECFSLVLHYNTGVAFSMFAFLGPWLKWIQFGLIIVLLWIILKEHYYKVFLLPAGLVMGAAISNLLDRFIHLGVVDYFAWHCGFRFAIFNFADVMINLAVVLFLWQIFIQKRSL
ncbi:MAG TPA: lipoprotein signal peptidase [Epsilonproteobacteria bacterium]|nr:lipoprotein signal peptidase [Campylobacterota bacterium]